MSCSHRFQGWKSQTRSFTANKTRSFDALKKPLRRGAAVRAEKLLLRAADVPFTNFYQLSDDSCGSNWSTFTSMHSNLSTFAFKLVNVYSYCTRIVFLNTILRRGAAVRAEKMLLRAAAAPGHHLTCSTPHPTPSPPDPEFLNSLNAAPHTLNSRS